MLFLNVARRVLLLKKSAVNTASLSAPSKGLEKVVHLNIASHGRWETKLRIDLEKIYN